MLDLGPLGIPPELRNLLQQIDRARENIIPVATMTADERERWARDYASNAVYHGARLDACTRTVIDLEEYRLLCGTVNAFEGVDVLTLPTVGFDDLMAELGLTEADLDDGGGATECSHI